MNFFFPFLPPVSKFSRQDTLDFSVLSVENLQLEMLYYVRHSKTTISITKRVEGRIEFRTQFGQLASPSTVVPHSHFIRNIRSRLNGSTNSFTTCTVRYRDRYRYRYCTETPLTVCPSLCFSVTPKGEGPQVRKTAKIR